MSKHLSSTAVFDSDLLIGPSTVSPDVKLHVIDSGTKVTPYADTVLAIQNSSVAGTNCVLNMISGNTNAPTVMIAEKGAAMILEDSKRDGR